MKPAATALLSKAHEDLREAQAVAEIGLPKLAARCAYYAAFHAAEALICELSAKVPKTHSGVHSEFARLLNDRKQTSAPLSAFLTRAYKHKQVNDYGPAEREEPSMEDSMAAIPMAVEFVACVEDLLSEA